MERFGTIRAWNGLRCSVLNAYYLGEPIQDKKILKSGGIYKITNPVNGKIYIGSTGRKGFKARWACEYNKYLTRSFEKHGKENFRFDILAICSPEERLELEQKFLNEFQPWAETGVGYNMRKMAGAPPENLTRTEESKKKMRAPRGPRSEETKQKLRDANKGMKFSPDVVERRAAKLRGRKNSPEHIEKSAASNRGKKRSEEFKERMRRLNLGKRLSEETKAKIGAASAKIQRAKKIAAGIDPDALKPVKNSNYSKEPKSQEVRAKISASLKSMWAEKRKTVQAAITQEAA